MNDPMEIFDLLLKLYQEQDLGNAGEKAKPSPLMALDSTFTTRDERLAARKGIEDFVDHCRRYIAENPPVSHIMLAQGFGVQLANGVEVALVPPTLELGGTMEHAAAFHVTEGRSQPGRGGTQATDAIAVTGYRPEPSRKNPKR